MLAHPITRGWHLLTEILDPPLWSISFGLNQLPPWTNLPPLNRPPLKGPNLPELKPPGMGWSPRSGVACLFARDPVSSPKTPETQRTFSFHENNNTNHGNWNVKGELQSDFERKDIHCSNPFTKKFEVGTQKNISWKITRIFAHNLT